MARAGHAYHHTKGPDETPDDASMSGMQGSRPPSQPAPAWRLLQRNRDFRLMSLAQLISYAGDWFLFVALAGLVYSLTHSAGLVALVLGAQTVPSAFLTFVGGPLADRLERQRMMVTADVVRGLLALGCFLIHSRS